MISLLVELPSPWEQGGGGGGGGGRHFDTSVLWTLWLIHQGSPKGIPGDDILSPMSFSNYLHVMLHQIIKPMTLVYKLVLRCIWNESQDLRGIKPKTITTPV